MSTATTRTEISRAVELPAEFLTAAHRMSHVFVTGTDVEADAAAQELTDQLQALTPDQVPAAEKLLAELAAAATTAAAVHRVVTGLPEATVTGTRPLPHNQQVHTLRLPDGSEIAVVTPAGDDLAAATARRALLTGRCTTCAATLGADWQMPHQPTCPAARHTGP